MAATKANRVFLNFPFDDGYAPLYVALVASVTAFGMTPRSVLEIPPQDVRLDRLFEIIGACGASIHDMSRVEPDGNPPLPRFNMPFELGLALGVHRARTHRWFVFESVRHRVTRTLTDLGGFDATIHGGEPQGVLRAVRDAFGATRRDVRIADLTTLWTALREVADHVRAEQGGLFTPAAFQDLVFAAQQQGAAHFRAHGASA